MAVAVKALEYVSSNAEVWVPGSIPGRCIFAQIDFFFLPDKTQHFVGKMPRHFVVVPLFQQNLSGKNPTFFVESSRAPYAKTDQHKSGNQGK